MKIDRLRQREILESLAKDYPSYSQEWFNNVDEKTEIAILFYLREHQLIDAALDQTIAGSFIFSGARITAKGLDFLADDGGLSAILGTITVKLHADTIRDLLLAKIESTSAPEEQKSWLRRQVSTMSGEALKTVTKSLVERGLQNMPDIIHWANGIFQN